MCDDVTSGVDQTEVVFSGQTVVAWFTYCIKVEYDVGYCEFVYVVSGIFLLPVWRETAVGGLLSPAMSLAD